ncbi:DUF5110 domain-containing protein [Sphingomonas aerolata]|uniref:DUF5110 domain-containing protein n=1 Tax=Sphingomonas aerolata TaxID=185951 RepID=UPI003A5B9E1E
MGVQVPSTATAQSLEAIRVYPGADAGFALYDDDGVTNDYRNKGGRKATLRWNDKTRRLTASGKLPTGQDAGSLVQIVAPK